MKTFHLFAGFALLGINVLAAPAPIATASSTTVAQGVPSSSASPIGPLEIPNANNTTANNTTANDEFDPAEWDWSSDSDSEGEATLALGHDLEPEPFPLSGAPSDHLIARGHDDSASSDDEDEYDRMEREKWEAEMNKDAEQRTCEAEGRVWWRFAVTDPYTCCEPRVDPWYRYEDCDNNRLRMARSHKSKEQKQREKEEKQRKKEEKQRQKEEKQRQKDEKKEREKEEKRRKKEQKKKPEQRACEASGGVWWRSAITDPHRCCRAGVDKWNHWTYCPDFS